MNEEKEAKNVEFTTLGPLSASGLLEGERAPSAKEKASKAKRRGPKAKLHAGAGTCCPDLGPRRLRSRFAEARAAEAAEGRVEREDPDEGAATRWGVVQGRTPNECGWTTTWDELLGRAIAAMDADGVEKLEKLRAGAERLRRKNPRAGEGVDVERVQRALAAYYDAQSGNGVKVKISRVFAVCGARLSDFFDGQKAFPEFAVVYDYLYRFVGDVRRMRAWEQADAALEAQERLITEEGCELNQRAVELGLKSGMREVFGDGAGEDERRGGGGKGGIVYNFPNLQQAWIVAPGAALAGAALGGAGAGVLSGDAARDAIEAEAVDMGAGMGARALPAAPETGGGDGDGAGCWRSARVVAEDAAGGSGGSGAGDGEEA